MALSGAVEGGPVDAHCHLTDPRLPGGAHAAIEAARAAGVEHMVLASGAPADWAPQAALAARSSAVSPVYGVHPWVAARAAAATRGRAAREAACDDLLGALADHLGRHPRGGAGAPVALGEVGWDRSPRLDAYRAGGDVAAADAAQERCLREQLRLALARELPVVLHVVRAHAQVLGVLRDLPRRERAALGARGGVVHGWSGSAELAQAFVRHGFHISFGAAVAQPGRRRVREAARAVPLGRVLVETDSPDTPLPGRPEALGEPAWLPAVVAALAEVRGEAPAALARATARNARRLFGLPARSG